MSAYFTSKQEIWYSSSGDFAQKPSMSWRGVLDCNYTIPAKITCLYSVIRLDWHLRSTFHYKDLDSLPTYISHHFWNFTWYITSFLIGRYVFQIFWSVKSWIKSYSISTPFVIIGNRDNTYSCTHPIYGFYHHVSLRHSNNNKDLPPKQLGLPLLIMMYHCFRIFELLIWKAQ